MPTMFLRSLKLIIIFATVFLSLAIPFGIVGAPAIPVWFTQVGATSTTEEVTEIEAALLSRLNSAAK